MRYIEKWPQATSMADVAECIARHLQVRQSLGSAVIIAERPVVLLSSVRKKWLQFVRALKTEHARTLDASWRATLEKQLQTLQNLEFTALPAQNSQLTAGVIIVDESMATSFMLPPSCRTLYISTSSTAYTGRFFEQMSHDSVVVEYSIRD